MSAKFFVADDAFGDEATCGICFNLWEDPVEVKPCEHIFCRKCFAEWGGDCPVCRKEVVGTETPCLPILRMLMRVKGVCHSCTWRGTYKEYKEKHMMVSCCNFSGPEVITPCSSEDDVPAPAVEPTPSTAAAESMNDYYLETPASPAIIPIPVVTSHELSAADYGLEDEDFNKLRNLACSFAQTDINSSGQPHLPWRSVCRLLRYLNYPNHPDDVENLFETAKQHPSTGAISFHALCLWLSLNRRNPQQWYNINNALYSRTLHLAQLLDTNQTGLFTLDQCFLLGEEYFGRCIQPAEWQTITVMLREKDTCIRQSFTVKSGTARGRSGSSDSDIKLPFHDTLLAFKRYRANTQQQIRQMEAEKKREDLVSRIKQMILHYEPPAASQIDHMLRSFKGEEEDLLKTLTLQYGPEPPPGKWN